MPEHGGHGDRCICENCKDVMMILGLVMMVMTKSYLSFGTVLVGVADDQEENIFYFFSVF